MRVTFRVVSVLALLLAACSPGRSTDDGVCYTCGSSPRDGGSSDAGPGDAGVPSCPDGETFCGHACTDVTVDPKNCQRCGAVCTANQICAASGCQTLPEMCPVNGSCPSGSYCNSSNKCIPGCMTDNNCGLGQICAGNSCTSGCRTTEACPSGDVCDNNKCRTACHRDTDCNLDQICNLDTLACVPGCTEDSRCQQSEVCDNGSCRAGCRSDSNCSSGQICDSSSRTCVTGCRTDSTCGSGQICDSATLTCRAGCRTDSNCSLGSYCKLSSHTCTTGCNHSDARCPSGQVCDSSTNTCRGGCSSDTACVVDQICASTTQMCAPGCRNDSGCMTGEICKSGQCAAGCRTDSQCPASSTICDATTLTCRTGCRSDDVCALNKYCDTTSATCVAGCNDNAARCPVGQACVSYTNGTTGCSAEYCGSDFSSSECNGSQYACYTIFASNTDSYCRLSCSPSADHCPTGYRCALFTDDPSAPNWGSTYYFCAKKCATNSDCTGAVMDLVNPSPCTCTSDGACRYGSTTDTEECYGASVSWAK